MLDKLSPFSYFRIHEFLDKSDQRSLSQVSRSINKRGWKTSVEYDGSDYKNFIHECSKHKFTLQRMIIKNIRDPLLWIPMWIRDMEFVNCGPVLSQIEAIPLSVRSTRKVNIKEDNSESKLIEVPNLSEFIH